MVSDPPSDVAIVFSVYSVILWAVVLALVAVLVIHVRPILKSLAARGAVPVRRLCARSAFFLAVFNLSPVMASVLELPIGAVLLFVPAFLVLGIALRRWPARGPVWAFLALVTGQVILDIAFIVVAAEHAEAFSGLVDLLVFRGHAEAENVIHVFFLLPADVALLFQLTKTVLGLTALIPAVVAVRRKEGG